jgi:diguanylate cyclase (GGDEF)-like protein
MNKTPISVLLVEDNPGDTRLIFEILSEAKGTHFVVECTDRLSTAREYLSVNTCDLVLLDLTLPDSRGLDTFFKIHTHVPEMPVVVLSGLDDETVATKAVQEGAQDYLVKGQVDTNLLVRSIRYAIERKRAEETIRRLAYYDSLTGLPNRVLFNDRLTLALAHARRNQQKLAVMLLDLDRFKNINDTLGHNMGDRLLRVVGDQLKNHLRKNDTVARMSGDEFMVLLPEIIKDDDAINVADKTLEVFRKTFTVNGLSLHVTASIGISIYPADGEDADTLVKNADIAMYRVKERGRDGYQTFRPV